MGFLASSSSLLFHDPCMDPHSPFLLNPNSPQHSNANLRDFVQSYNAAATEVALFKPDPLSLTLQRYGPPVGTASTSDDASRSSVPLGPFTGYASILKGSRFLKPAQRLLEQSCDVATGIYVQDLTSDSSLMDPPPPLDTFTATDNGGNKSTLLSMLQEVDLAFHSVYRRYKEYYQQLQAVVASFEHVSGLGNAAPYADLALKTMSKHFRCLKNAITDQIQITIKVHSHMSIRKDETSKSGNIDRGRCSQRPIQKPGFLERQSIWRPQRGLPERAVSVLRAWLFDHFLHPYPTDTDKLMLAKQTGLSRNQVSNWFINARVRLWKPMVEEIHMLETREAQRVEQREEQNSIRLSDHVASENSLASENPSTTNQQNHDTSKHTGNEASHVPAGHEEALNLSYNLSSHSQVGAGVSMGSGNNGVSLTLGLQQNNGVGLSEAFPINAAQLFGVNLDAGNDQGFCVSSLEAQSRQFGRDLIGGQLLRDFAG